MKATHPLERALVFLTSEAEYLQIERKGNGSYAIALGDQGLNELPDGLGADLRGAVVDAVMNIRTRARQKQEMADAVLAGLRTAPRELRRRR